MKNIFSTLAVLLLTSIIMQASAQVPGYSMSNPIDAGIYNSTGTYSDTQNSITGGFTNNYGNAANDVWYKFTISTTSSFVLLALCESNFDTYLHVLNSAGTEIASNDDNGAASCSENQSSLALYNLAAGTYYVVAEGYANNNGIVDFFLNVNITQQLTINYPAGSKIFATGTAISPLSPTVTNGPTVAITQTSTFAGLGSQGLGDGSASTATFRLPLAVAADAANNIYVADADNHAIRKITPAGVVTTLAGNGSPGNINGTGVGARFNHPAGLAIDAAGDIFVADQMNNLIRKITQAGVVTTFAGNGTVGSTNGTGANVSFNNPTGVCFDNAGNLLVADYSNNMIRKITPAGVVTTFAGTGAAGATNSTTALLATFKNPMSMAVDASGNIYVADRLNNLIRKITPAGVVSTLAGSGVAGYADGTGTAAAFKTPTSLKADAIGNIYLTDQGNNLIRKITPAAVVTTLVGELTPGMTNGVGIGARFSNPYGISLDSQGNIYVADAYNYMIRKIAAKAFIVNPDLPAGLVLDGTTGVISGTPTTVSPTASYTVIAYSATNTNGTTATISIGVSSGNITPSADQNYIVNYAPHIDGLMTTSAVTSVINDKAKIMTTVDYFDGLGRPMQTVRVKGSPSGMDIVQPVVYDELGREPVKYMPYVLTTGISDGSYKINALTAQSEFYTIPPAGVSTISAPYAVTVFEPSPLNRVTEQGTPGTDWQPIVNNTSGHTNKIVYNTNNATPITDTANSTLVALYSISAIDAITQQRTLVKKSNYGAGQLYLTISKDENWKNTGLGNSRGGTTEEYKDKTGHVVLKRTFNYRPTQTSPVVAAKLEILSTYYVYDDLGNLAYVLPPGANPDAGLTSAANQTTLDNLCYQYRYDERHRLTQKKLPGKGWEYMVYNKLDQMVATQDANQRGKATPEWTVTRYDALEREIMTGIYNYGTMGFDVRAAVQAQANNQTTPWETPTGAATNYGYTAVSFPATISTTLSVNYYDDYRLAGTNPYPFSTGSDMTKSLPTGSLINVLGTTNMLWDVMYYDKWGRNIESFKQHYLGGGTPSPYNYDEISSDYDFTDQVKSTIRKHYTKSGSTAVLTVTVANNYDYDHMGRRVNTWEQITNGTLPPDIKVLLAKNDYNETGQVWKKHLHSADQGVTFKQDVAYTYNERGWLLKTDAPLFEESLQYNTSIAKNGLTPVKQYNGNIAAQSWGTTAVPDTKTYIYRYDLLNRLTAGTSSDNYNESNIEYDLNGNINKLKRTTGSATFTDDLQYTYTNATGAYTNQLQSINDITTSDLGQKHGSFTYAYDANGNLVTDNSKGFTGASGITYNLLNLPQAIASKSTTYTYDAAGQKLSRLIGTAKTDYIGGIQYETMAGVTAISFIQTEEGRAISNGTTAYNYEYALTDHLGNSRVNFDTGTGNARLVQTDNYYPFGMDIVVGSRPSVKNNYLYNKKELQENLGLYDYGARFYDPAVGRWTSVDPLAESDRMVSAYGYVMNNPLRFIDPDGMAIADYYDAQGNYLGHDDNDDLKVFVMKAGLVPNLQNKSIDWGGSLNSKQANDLKANSEEAETPGKIGYSLDKGENASSDKYNKFDKEIAVATHLLNREIKAGTLSVGEGYSKGKNATKLDVNLVKALAYKESRLGQGQSVATKASDIFSMFHPGDYGDKSKMGMTLADVKNGAGSLKSTYWGVRWLHFKSYMSEDGKTKDFQGWNYGVNKYGPGQKDPRYLETVLKIYKSIE